MNAEIDITHLCQIIEQILGERERYKYEVLVESNEILDKSLIEDTKINTD